MIAVTRRYRFPAAHVLRHPSFSDAENQRVYGKCANPHGHGHDYGLEVTVRGPLDPATGWVADPARIDAVVEASVLGRFSHRMLNEDPAFADAVPTAENIARVCHGLLAVSIENETGAALQRIRVRETPRNHFDFGDLQ